MEQEKETQATYHDRSVDELRRDIILKAEEIAKEPKKGDKIFLLVIVILGAIFGIVNWHYKWIELNWWVIIAVLGFILLIGIGFYKINERIFKTIKSAEDANQQLKAAKRLKRAVQLRTIFGYIAGVLLYVAIRYGDNFEEWLFVLIFAGFVIFICSLIILFNSKKFVDDSYCEDLEELENSIS